MLYPRSAAEIAAGITPTNYSYEIGNVPALWRDDPRG